MNVSVPFVLHLFQGADLILLQTQIMELQQSLGLAKSKVSPSCHDSPRERSWTSGSAHNPGHKCQNLEAGLYQKTTAIYWKKFVE